MRRLPTGPVVVLAFFKLRISRRKLLELAVLYAVARPSSASSMALQDPQRGHGAHARAAQFEP